MIAARSSRSRRRSPARRSAARARGRADHQVRRLSPDHAAHDARLGDQRRRRARAHRDRSVVEGADRRSQRLARPAVRDLGPEPRAARCARASSASTRPTRAKGERLGDTLDKVTAKFGKSAIKRAILVTRKDEGVIWGSQCSNLACHRGTRHVESTALPGVPGRHRIRGRRDRDLRDRRRLECRWVRARPHLRFAEDDARPGRCAARRARRLQVGAGRHRRPPDARPAAHAHQRARRQAQRAMSPLAARAACSSITAVTPARPRSISAREELLLVELRATPAPAAGDAHGRRPRCVSERRVLARQGRAARRRLLVQLAAAARRDRRRGARVVDRAASCRRRASSSSRRTSRTTCSSACAARATRTTTVSSRSTRRIATRITRRCSRPPRPRSVASTSRSRSISRATAKCRCRIRARRPRHIELPAVARGQDARRGQALRSSVDRRDLQGQGRRGADRGRARRVPRDRASGHDAVALRGHRRRRRRSYRVARKKRSSTRRPRAAATSRPSAHRVSVLRRRRAPGRLHRDARGVRLQARLHVVDMGLARSRTSVRLNKYLWVGGAVERLERAELAARHRWRVPDALHLGPRDARPGRRVSRPRSGSTARSRGSRSTRQVDARPRPRPHARITIKTTRKRTMSTPGPRCYSAAAC